MTAAGRIVLTLGLMSVPMQPVTLNPSSQASIPVTLTARIADGRRQFRPGEIIPIELEFNSAVSNRFVVDGATYDRSGRLRIDEFRIEPEDAVTDPLLDYFASLDGYISGGGRAIGVLGGKPFTVRLELNEWCRFDKAGMYALSVRSRRVIEEPLSPETPRSVLPVTSNAVSFEILPRDRDWEEAALAAALQLLESSPSPSRVSPRTVDRRNGCRTLRFLATDAAVDEMIKRYDGLSGCDFDFMAGLFGAPNRDRAVRQLEDGLRARDQPVTQSYLRTLAVLSVYAQRPEFRPPQTRDNKARIPLGEPTRHQDLIQAAHAKYKAILSAALPGKTERARSITLTGRLPARDPPPAYNRLPRIA